MHTLSFEDGRKPNENIHSQAFAVDVRASVYFQKMRTCIIDNFHYHFLPLIPI